MEDWKSINRVVRVNNQKGKFIFVSLGVCNRTNPAYNPCVASSNLITCLETDDYGTTFACLCMYSSGPAVTTSANCGKYKAKIQLQNVNLCFSFGLIDLLVTSTSTTVTTSSTIVSDLAPVCLNGGYFISNVCHCPSGFGGALCELKFGKLISFVFAMNIYFLVQIIDCVKELLVKIEVYALFVIQMDRLNLFVYVHTVLQVIIVNYMVRNSSILKKIRYSMIITNRYTGLL